MTDRPDLESIARSRLAAFRAASPRQAEPVAAAPASMVHGLVTRNVTGARVQVSAKAVSALPIRGDGGMAEPRNHRVEITWR